MNELCQSTMEDYSKREVVCGHGDGKHRNRKFERRVWRALNGNSRRMIRTPDTTWRHIRSEMARLEKKAMEKS